MTLHKGWDSFTPEVGTKDKCNCKICGTEMCVERNCSGPTSYVEFLGDISRTFDHFTCQYSGEVWHDTVHQLRMEMQKTASVQIKGILEAEANELVSKNIMEQGNE
jgi:hypothetical protein